VGVPIGTPHFVTGHCSVRDSQHRQAPLQYRLSRYIPPGPENRNSFVGSDIEQPLTRRNLIKPTDLFPKQAKDFDLYLVQPFNEVVQLALHGHADAMNPFE
jgi:hypothetical protein